MRGITTLKDNLSLVGKKVVGRESLLRTVMLALLTRQHVMVIGKPGTAKTLLAKEVFNTFIARKFSVTCTKRMSEEYLVGPLNMAKFRKSGEYVHITDGTIIDSDLAFIDEFLDLPDQASRALLEILNERTFTRGKQKEKSKLWTAIAATNFSPSGEALEAVEDRFMFRTVVTSLKDGELLDAIRGVDSARLPLPIKMTMRDLSALYRRIMNYRVHNETYKLYGGLVAALRASGLNITDRRAVRGVQALKALSYVEGHTYAHPSMLLQMDEVFTIKGDDKQSAKFAQVASATVGAVRNLGAVLDTLNQVEEAVFMLQKDIAETPKDDDKKISAIITRTENFIHACEHDPAIRVPAGESEIRPYINTAVEMLRKLEKDTNQ